MRHLLFLSMAFWVSFSLIAMEQKGFENVQYDEKQILNYITKLEEYLKEHELYLRKDIKTLNIKDMIFQIRNYLKSNKTTYFEGLSNCLVNIEIFLNFFDDKNEINADAKVKLHGGIDGPCMREFLLVSLQMLKFQFNVKDRSYLKEHKKNIESMGGCQKSYDDKTKKAINLINNALGEVFVNKYNPEWMLTNINKRLFLRLVSQRIEKVNLESTKVFFIKKINALGLKSTDLVFEPYNDRYTININISKLLPEKQAF